MYGLGLSVAKRDMIRNTGRHQQVYLHRDSNIDIVIISLQITRCGFLDPNKTWGFDVFLFDKNPPMKDLNPVYSLTPYWLGNDFRGSVSVFH